ncbi:MAG: hypothetical protein ACRYF3_07665 [Janthinobacterium lividum]
MTDAVPLAVEALQRAGVPMSPGLSDAELHAIERSWSFRFAEDHRRLLQVALPVGPKWVDWRSAPRHELRERLDAPIEGVLFDVGHNEFWAASWGERPTSSHAALRRARREVSLWPTLVPLYSHRYLAAWPAGPGGPVLSVHQTDVIHYGNDLVSYLHREGLAVGLDNWTAPLRPVPVWSQLAQGFDGPDL